MGLSMDEVRKIKKEYVQEYFFKEPYSNYINSCGISKLAIKNRNNNIKLEDGEELSDLCIGVGFEKEPPKDLDFPDKYKGVRVFYEVIGEIRAL